MNELVFHKYFDKFYTRLNFYEENKKMPMRYSCAAKDLAIHYGIFIKSSDETIKTNSQSRNSIKTSILSMARNV